MPDNKDLIMAMEIPTKMGQAGQNPIVLVQVKLKDMNDCFRRWLAKQCLPVEAAVVTVQGAAIGALMGTLTGDVSSLVARPPNSEATASFRKAKGIAGSPSVHARNFAVMRGKNAGISCVMRRLRGKEDIQSR